MLAIIRRALGGWPSFPPGATPPTVPIDGPVVFTCPDCGTRFERDHTCAASADPETGSR